MYATHDDLIPFLPPLPDRTRRYAGTGWEWMQQLRTWSVVDVWGCDGWSCGLWPYQIVATVTVPMPWQQPIYGMATYTEGDVNLTAYANWSELREAISRYAFGIWTMQDSGPKDLPEDYRWLPERYRQPHRPGTARAVGE